MSTDKRQHRSFPQRSGFLSVVCLAAAMMFPFGAHAVTNPFLAGQQVDSSDISPFTKWTALMPRYEMQVSANTDTCIGNGCINQKWEALITQLEGKPVKTQLDAVNRFFNAIKYVSDEDNYGVADYWQTPYELMERGGDCEDYAIAKYITLKRLGVPESAMRIIVVRDAKLNGTIHAVLEVTDSNADYILDNQIKSVVSAAKIFHYQPVFAINEAKWWAYK
jgi:predicted transglutaminase-like cysteine proteinase